MKFIETEFSSEGDIFFTSYEVVEPLAFRLEVKQVSFPAPDEDKWEAYVTIADVGIWRGEWKGNFEKEYVGALAQEEFAAALRDTMQLVAGR